MDVARNCTAGKNCDFASHGMVTAPESQGSAGSQNAAAKIKTVSGSGTRARVFSMDRDTLAPYHGVL